MFALSHTENDDDPLKDEILSLRFQREKVEDVVSEIIPLIVHHSNDISEYKEILLKPNFEGFTALDNAGVLRLYTARNQDQQILGYTVFVVNFHMHYQDVLQATQSLLYIHPEHRGFGFQFLKWCETELIAEKVELIYMPVTSRFDFSPILKRMGYHISETYYSRRIH